MVSAAVSRGKLQQVSQASCSKSVFESLATSQIFQEEVQEEFQENRYSKAWGVVKDYFSIFD